MMNSKSLNVFVLLVAGVVNPHLLADTIVSINLDTHSLIGYLGCPCAINYQLTRGDPASVNSVTVSGIGLGGGIPQGVPDISGGISGDLFNGVVLTTASFINDFVQDFQAGDFIRFTLVFSTNYSGAGPVDRLTMAILAGGIEIPTLGPGDALLGIDLLPNTTVETYSSDRSRTALPLGPPQVVPEPATFTLLGIALISIAAFAGRKRPPQGM